MVALIDMVGKSFNYWEVIGPYEKRKTRIFWKCRCICGIEKYISGIKLRGNKSRSCGCKRFNNCRKVKHGMYKTREYSIWRKMKNRCFSNKANNYSDYGGRGISVCKKWLDFKNFYKDMGDCPDGYSLDRIDINGNYCKENCKWSNKIEQSNNKRNTVYVTINNIIKPIQYWVKKLKIPAETIKRNSKNGILEQDYIDNYKPANRKKKKESFRQKNIEIYKIYVSIKCRCKNNNKEFYKGWIDNFKLFFNHIGPRPSSKHSVDRIDNSKGYIPDNIRWATPIEQARNKTNNRFLTIDNKTLCITEWAQIAKTDTSCIRRRLKKGLSIRESVFWKTNGE